MGGRLGNSTLASSKKQQTILHGKDPLTEFIVVCKHCSLLHARPTLLISALGANFHILRARCLVRSTCISCVTCKKTEATTEQQLIGSQLATPSVNPALPFSHTGMDFCGSFTIKKGHIRRPIPILVYSYASLQKQHTLSWSLISPQRAIWQIHCQERHTYSIVFG